MAYALVVSLQVATLPVVRYHCWNASVVKSTSRPLIGAKNVVGTGVIKDVIDVVNTPIRRADAAVNTNCGMFEKLDKPAMLWLQRSDQVTMDLSGRGRVAMSFFARSLTAEP